ncbi:hypothetical protein AB6N01_09990 [Alcaligenes nematophilus]|uniref:Lipoprotein n=3 Tax=Alcaligenes TaxID=507 RepID=A0ABY7N4D8_ALCFA|nr:MULTISPECIES: hypothetical protein [Alcaligenes]AYN21969.1 hypothetical protein D3M96_16385 [Alcaligenes aquatilis]MCX5565764.1 hypothetical protein [Alcaligenes phenolicus]WBM37577.1 hypothetical protein M2J83_17520 [Alcaligenes faecalis]
MNRRYFLSAFGALSLTLLSGCQDNLNAPFVGYWLEQKDERPATLHVTEDGPNLVVRVRQISMISGTYRQHNFPAKARENGVMTISDKWQLTYDKSQKHLTDSDGRYKPFKKISESEYKSLTSD